MSDDQAELIEISESEVLHYLQQNPEFLLKHPNTVSMLKVPHGLDGSISLIEHQQALLQKKNAELETNIKQLVTTASQNEVIYKAFLNLYMALLECPNSKQLVHLIENILIKEINLESVNLVLFISDNKNEIDELVKSRSLFKALLDNRLSKDDYYFGRLKQQESELFFGPEKTVKSVALIRLGEQKDLGILAFASQDESHFQPDMDTLFLEPMVKLINRLLFNYIGH